MPEGPLLIIYKESLSALIGARVESADTKLRTASLQTLEGRTLTGITTWGKYLFLIFGDDGQNAPHFGGGTVRQNAPPPGAFLRIHWGMFGIYYLDTPHPAKAPTATFSFSNGRVLYLYSVSLRTGEGLPSEADYDPRIDVMSERWDSKLALKNIRALPAGTMDCDALLDQTIFAGLGNAIKTEALFAQRIHPESLVKVLPVAALRALIEEAVGQSQLFLEGKRAFGEARYGWVLIYRKKTCPVCGAKVGTGFTGVLQRKSHWCRAYQKRWV